MLRYFVSLVLTAALAFEAVPAAAKSPKTTSPTDTERRIERLGVGQHIMVRTAQGEVLHGHIVKINAQTFTLKPDDGAPVEIAYADVAKVRKNPGPVVWMLLGAAVVIIIIAIAK
jgi:preprotein translocase subunit YajC